MIGTQAICGILVQSALLLLLTRCRKSCTELQCQGMPLSMLHFFVELFLSCHNQVSLLRVKVQTSESWCPEASPRWHCVSACCHRIAKYLQSTAFTPPRLSGVNCKCWMNEYIAAGWGSRLVLNIHKPLHIPAPPQLSSPPPPTNKRKKSHQNQNRCHSSVSTLIRDQEGKGIC